MPHVVFRLRPSLDVKMALAFFDVLPELKGIQRLTGAARKREVTIYVHALYRQHHGYLQEQQRHFQQEWNAVEKEFLREVGNVFPKFCWPAGKYVGYISVINCNPRFLHNKTFQAFSDHPDGVRYVAAHELMHFAFYHYCRTALRARFAGMDTEQGIFWHLAEIFNDVILSQPAFVRIHGRRTFCVYPEHRQWLRKAKEVWRKDPSVAAWTATMLKMLEKSM